MTHVLQNLLQISDENPFFVIGMDKLEKTTGSKGIDTRIIADIITKSHKVMRQIGLDVADTTGKELYYALNALVFRGDAEDFLEDTDFVLINKGKQLISFNLIDVIENAHHELPYGKQSVFHGQRSLKGEIFNRYLKHNNSDVAQTCEIAGSMGILQHADSWYNYEKYKHKQNKVKE